MIKAPGSGGIHVPFLFFQGPEAVFHEVLVWAGREGLQPGYAHGLFRVQGSGHGSAQIGDFFRRPESAQDPVRRVRIEGVDLAPGLPPVGWEGLPGGEQAHQFLRRLLFGAGHLFIARGEAALFPEAGQHGPDAVQVRVGPFALALLGGGAPGQVQPFPGGAQRPVQSQALQVLPPAAVGADMGLPEGLQSLAGMIGHQALRPRLEGVVVEARDEHGPHVFLGHAAGGQALSHTAAGRQAVEHAGLKSGLQLLQEQGPGQGVLSHDLMHLVHQAHQPGPHLPALDGLILQPQVQQFLFRVHQAFEYALFLQIGHQGADQPVRIGSPGAVLLQALQRGQQLVPGGGSGEDLLLGAPGESRGEAFSLDAVG